MKNTITNRQVICDVLMEQAAEHPEITVLCSDSRGSASLGSFAKAFPDQFVEIGIAEQNLVSIAAGLANCGQRPFAASPASFLSTRSYEQIKVDVAYSHTNVKLIGISGGVSYGALGMTHHSLQDLAALSAIPGMRVYLPSDRFQTRKLMEILTRDSEGAYIRIGRNAVEDVYPEENGPCQMNQATLVRDGHDMTMIACGEMVKPAKDAAEVLDKEGISVRVLDMYCIKPMDEEAVLRAARETGRILTVEEHSVYGGLGSMVARLVGEACPVPIKTAAIPDEPVITGTSAEVFAYYGLDAAGLQKKAKELMQRGK